MTDAGREDQASEEAGREDQAAALTATSEEPLRRRVVEQFSGTGDRAAVWRGFDRILPTAEYLNLGYSPWYLPTLVGDSQARLAARLADGLADRVSDPAGVPLLDLGCGRGGPARQFAARGFAVTGLDLVAHNVALARANAGAMAGTDRAERPRFLVGDGTALPFADGAFVACVAVDSLVYVPEAATAFAEIERMLVDDGWLAASTLVAAADAGPATGDPLAAFADAWDLAPIEGTEGLLDRLRAAGFTVETVEDVTPNSVGRFRKWTRPFLALADGPTGDALRGILRRWDVDPDAAVGQVRAAHRALPHLEHVVLYARA